MGGSLSGQITYGDFDPDLNFGYPEETVEVDVDHDGLIDIAFEQRYLGYGDGLKAVGKNGAEVAWARSYSFFDSCDYNVVKAAQYGAPLYSSAADWRNNAWIIIDSFPCAASKWSNGELAFMGYRKPSGSGFQYGWMRIERNGGDITVYDYALNTAVEAMIRAGDTGDTCAVAQDPRSSVDGSGNVNIKWIDVARADSYEIEATETSSGSSYIRTTFKNDVDLPPVPPRTYAWRVRAVCPIGTGDYTEMDTITVPVLRQAELKSSFEVYPNPGSGNLRVNLGENQFQFLRLYSMNGQMLAEWQVEGMSGIEIFVDQAAGNYLLVANSDDRSERKLLMIE